jgi:DNA-binding transcriptional LysR family regulator
MTTAQAVATVAAGAGVLVVPMSVARLHHRRDVAAVPVTGVAGATVALVWRRDRDDEVCQELVAVVRGRTAGSSRG